MKRQVNPSGLLLAAIRFSDHRQANVNGEYEHHGRLPVARATLQAIGGAQTRMCVIALVGTEEHTIYS